MEYGARVVSNDDADDAHDSLFHPGRRSDLLQLLGRYSANHVEATRHLAEVLQVHTTDATAVAEILWADASSMPLNPVRLAKRIGLSSGATAALLNRLETSGHVLRTRTDADRRIVRLHLSEATRTTTTTFFASSGQGLDHVLDAYDDDTLGRFGQLLSEIVAATTAQNARLRPPGR